MIASMDQHVTAELSPGEQNIRAKRRRRWAILGGLALVGLIPGFLLGYFEADAAEGGGPTIWPAWTAILLSVSYLLAILIGSKLFTRQMDEHELLGKYKAACFAGNLLLLVYPVWLFLWMGAMAPEPIHWVLFLLFYSGLCGADLYYRIRGVAR